MTFTLLLIVSNKLTSRKSQIVGPLISVYGFLIVIALVHQVAYSFSNDYIPIVIMSAIIFMVNIILNIWFTIHFLKRVYKHDIDFDLWRKENHKMFISYMVMSSTFYFGLIRISYCKFFALDCFYGIVAHP